MKNNINFIKAKINSHNNWEIIENSIKNSIMCNKKITFISFCEMYFYKGGKSINNNWVGIIHDPEDTNKYYGNKNLFKNENFLKSLLYCKGLFCMSINLKKFIINTLKPNFFVELLYHPISQKNLKEFDMKLYKNDKNIIQIGNWLRRTYSIFKVKTKINKEILPYNDRTKNELNYFLKKDKILLNLEEKNSVTKISPLSDNEYNKLFSNKIIFLNLYSSTANNVIMECIKSNNPIIINKLDSVVYYLGDNYPLYYNNLSEVTNILENDDLILKGHNYLKNMNKDKFTISNMINIINKNLKKIN